jgi:hypothetical protein
LHKQFHWVEALVGEEMADVYFVSVYFVAKGFDLTFIDLLLALEIGFLLELLLL